MIAFATLFLGLVLGAHPVELAVQGEVSSVQLVLDGQQVATIAGPPWKRDVDLGATLRPHQLEARALAPDGRTLATARQFVNLPRAPAELVAGKDLPARLFKMTQPFTRDDGSFAWLLTRIPAPPPQTHQRLTDALAVAALQAAGGARPRAVVAPAR